MQFRDEFKIEKQIWLFYIVLWMNRHEKNTIVWSKKKLNFAYFHQTFLSSFSFALKILIRTFRRQASFLNFSRKTSLARLLGWLQSSFGLGILICRNVGSAKTKMIWCLGSRILQTTMIIFLKSPGPPDVMRRKKSPTILTSTSMVDATILSNRTVWIIYFMKDFLKGWIKSIEVWST